MIKMGSRKDEKFPNFFADRIRREIGESLPVKLHNPECDEYEYEDNGIINTITTDAILSMSKNLAHTKELEHKKPKYNYITELLMIGIRIIKSKIQHSQQS